MVARIGAEVGLVFGGSLGGSTVVIDGVTGVGDGVPVGVSTGIGDMGVDSFGAQPNTTSSARTNMNKGFDFVTAS